MNFQRAHKWLVIASIVLALVWTLLMWGVFGLLSVTDEGLSHALLRFGATPEVTEWALYINNFAQDVGNVLVIMLWAVGLVALLLLTWIGNSILKRAPQWRHKLQAIDAQSHY